MRRSTIGMLAATGVLAATVSFSGTATAGETGATAACPKGAFCMYTGSNQTGTMYPKYGNWSGTINGIKSVYNNGSPQPGYDHVTFTWQYKGRTFSKCFHYPFDVPYKTNYVGVTAKKVVWRGEC
ncbi:peptidase inhibitor family I36 protein [Streptomyces sp. C11-1]|uniref:Peptidase inhibitor family I36 protein n=1 Tax=Streptomyces durocortorensis TaxID=2811104 RepID=A0ABY9VVP4_9ACTN|nr:peptidase inhibitor family I36 protein [Streptomyces durocortorensis]WNF27778.1 peptidase inhibitor family I36 protein [Streptomyces durocortorensis]